MSEAGDVVAGKPIDEAIAAYRAGRYDEADAIAVLILGETPDVDVALAIRGYVATVRRDEARAMMLFERATALRQEPAWLALLADLYVSQFRPEDARRAAELALSHTEREARARPLAALARACTELGDVETAKEAYLGMLAIDRTDAAAHVALGHLLLATGEYAPGWIEFEWRDRLPQAQQPKLIPEIKGALWNGMRLRGRLLVVCDQGYGDCFQFARFLTEAATRAESLVVACDPDMVCLFETIPGVAGCVPSWRALPPFLAWTHLGSLPGTLGVTLETLVAPEVYLTAPEAPHRTWSERLAERGGRAARIGLFWSGRPTHPNNARRSIALSRLGPVLEAGRSATLVSLQKERPDEDARALARAGVLDPAHHLKDFGETAGLIASLDLVITVDSGVAHLAGALGRPVWLLTPQPADWRWLIGRQDSPWYPSMRLFRQERPGDWDAVVVRVVDALAGFLSGRS